MKAEKLNYIPEPVDPEVPFDPDQHYDNQLTTFLHSYVDDLIWIEKIYESNQYKSRLVVLVSLIFGISIAAFLFFSNLSNQAFSRNSHWGIATVGIIVCLLLAFAAGALMVRRFFWHKPIMKKIALKAIELKQLAAIEWAEERYKVTFGDVEAAYKALFTTGVSNHLVRTKEGQLIESRVVVGEGYILCDDTGKELKHRTPPELILP
jgi:hypothetical protein